MSFTSIIIYPFAWLLLQLHNIFGSYGIAIILFSLIVKLITLPFNMKSKKGMMKSARLSPEIQELQKRYGSNRMKLNEEMQKLYKEHDAKPSAGCLWSMIPLVIMLILYSAIRQPMTHLMHLTAEEIQLVSETLTGLGLTVPTEGAYTQIAITNMIFENFEAVKAVVPGVLKLDFSFLGMNMANQPGFKWFSNFNLQEFGLFLLPVISGGLSWVSMKIAQKSQPAVAAEAASTMNTMNIMMPIMSIWFGFIMPAFMSVYWIANSVFSTIQDVILTRIYNKQLDKADAERLAKQRAVEEERAKKRAEYEKLKAMNATTRNKNTSKKKVHKTERQAAEEVSLAYEKQRRAEELLRRGFAPKEEKPVNDRPFARGRAYDPNRFAEAEALRLKREAEKAVEDAKAKAEAAQQAAIEEAERRDEEAFERFLQTGKVEDDPWTDREAEDNDGPWEQK